MIIVILLKSCLLLGQYHLKWRTKHTTIRIGGSLYCWAGHQENLPSVHDSEEKRKFTSYFDIFHLPTFKWELKSSKGSPPAGVRYYASTSIGNKIIYFGGNCKPDDCYHNNLYELNTLSNNTWMEIVSSTPDNAPMRKHGCKMISFNINREYVLLLFGGYGPTPITKQVNSQYIPVPNIPNRFYTNETHIMCVTTSPGIT